MCLSNARQPYATIFVWLSGFTLIETICPKVCLKSRPKSAKSPLPVDVRISALVPQLSFHGETSSGVANSSVFSDSICTGKKYGLYNKH